MMVALLWVANLTPVLFVVDVVMQNRSIPDWVDEQQQQAVTTYQQLQAEQTKLADAELPTAAAELKLHQFRQRELNSDLYSASWWVSIYQHVKPWSDRWLPNSAYATLVGVCLFLLVGTFIKNLFRIAGVLLAARIAGRAALDLRDAFYAKVLRLDLSDYGESGRGELMNRCTSDLTHVGDGIQTLFGMAVREPLKMIACCVGAALVSWQLLLMTMLVAPLAYLSVRYLSKALKRANRRAMEELSSIYEALGETLAGIRLIKAYTTEKREQNRFAGSNQMLYRRQMRIAFYNSLVSPVTENLGVAMVVMAAMAGGYLVVNGETHLFGIQLSSHPLTHGEMMMFFGMLIGMTDPARRLSGVFNSLQRASASAERLYAVLDREATIVDPQQPLKLPTPVRGVEFENVFFRYDGDKPVLGGVNFDVRPGETIAIVGPNGCGKSTLLNLVPRFYDVQAGAVRLGGVDVRDAALEDLRSRIGVVSQQALLLNDTVAANIAYGAPDATQEQIEQAARQAHAHSFITEKLADGYDTVVGLGGGRLSGGQRQRIALARAVLRDPEILILDEATSQIDVESEQLIHQVLKRFVVGRTTLIVTHRTSTLSLADRVVVMDHGAVEDMGAPEELLARCDLFRRLCHVGGYRESA